jgi:hypothetical protein
MNLVPFFEKAVVELNRCKSAELGDRNTYIGSSDVASCARKVFMQRKFPTTPSVSTLLKFSRGHVAEMLIEKIFDAGGVHQLYDTQVELKHPDYPLKAHVDFLFYADLDGKPGLHIVEIKSVSGIPEEPYPQWVDQVHYQMGLLQIHYPQAPISASVLAVDLNGGEIFQFTGFKPDEPTFNYLFCRALYLLDCLDEKDTPRTSVSHLCSYCSYRSDCPEMNLPQVNLPPEIEALAARYAELNSAKNAADKEMRSIRQELVDFTGPTFIGRSDTVDMVVTSIAPSAIVDGSLLKKLYPDIYPSVLKERAGYTKLECKPHRLAA